MAAFQIDPLSRIPLYEQLKKQVLRLGALGLLDPEEPMPSVRQLAAELGINPNTVQKAYRELERDELIISVPGKGSFLASTETHIEKLKSEMKRRLQELMLSAKDAGFGEEDFGRLFAEALSEVYAGSKSEMHADNNSKKESV